VNLGAAIAVVTRGIRSNMPTIAFPESYGLREYLSFARDHLPAMIEMMIAEGKLKRAPSKVTLRQGEQGRDAAALSVLLAGAGAYDGGIHPGVRR
jgi:hypothetical protein